MTRETEALKDTLLLLKGAGKVLICAHRAPDGDTLGSVLALASLLERSGADPVLVCHDPVPENLAFLPGAQRFRLPKELNQETFDLSVAVDSSDLERLGDAAPLFLNAPKNAQIDHHPTNLRYSQHNLVLDHLPATASIIYMLFQTAGMTLTAEEATCLYTGTSTDTGSFCFGAITAETFEQMAGLMRAGLPLVETARQLHLMKQKNDVLLLGRALSSLTFYAEGRLSGMRLTLGDFEALAASQESGEGIVNHGLYIPGVRLCYLATETQEGIRISLRSLAPLDVGRVAKELGGGGHAQASGCTLQVSLEEAERRVRQALIDLLPA